MLAMDQIHRIRQLYYEQGLNISEIAKREGKDWKTVRKYIDQQDFNIPEAGPAPRPSYPKLEPYKPLIDQWLLGDLKAPRKQRHTAKRVYARLKEEDANFNCSYRLVAQYVSEKKQSLNLKHSAGYIPLIHYPGEAQADFGEAVFFENGIKHTGKYFVIDFPYSNAGYVQLHYGENMECLLESLKAIFEHIGGVPTEIWFDNTSTIVTKIMRGGGRELTERFIRFQEHYGFIAKFMNPHSGNEKGGVENKVGYDRRNFFVPIPRFISIQKYNSELLKLCDEDTDRNHYRYEEETISERFEIDTKALRILPDIPFDTAQYKCVSTDKWGKFSLYGGKHIYSASPGFAQQEIWIKVTAEEVIALDQKQQVIAKHRRLYGDEVQESMQWLPYLKFIAKKPRSLRNSGIYTMMPESMQQYLDNCQNSERGKILKVLSELTERSGFENAVQTVDQAIAYQANDAASLQNLFRRLFSDMPELPPLQLPSDVPALTQLPSGIQQYDTFLARRCSG